MTQSMKNICLDYIQTVWETDKTHVNLIWGNAMQSYENKDGQQKKQYSSSLADRVHEHSYSCGDYLHSVLIDSCET